MPEKKRSAIGSRTGSLCVSGHAMAGKSEINMVRSKFGCSVSSNELIAKSSLPPGPPNPPDEPPFPNPDPDPPYPDPNPTDPEVPRPIQSLPEVIWARI
jgi:hypothetical protein